MTVGSTKLAATGASLGSYNKGYVVYGKRMNNRYARYLDDPEWNAPLGTLTPSMELPFEPEPAPVPMPPTPAPTEDEHDIVVTLAPTESPNEAPPPTTAPTNCSYIKHNDTWLW